MNVRCATLVCSGSSCFIVALLILLQIGNWLLQHIVRMLQTSQEAKDRQTTFIICLTLASIVKALSVNEINLTEEQQRILCQAFLIQASEDGSSCFEMEFIDKHYSKQRYSNRGLHMFFVH